MRSERQEVEDLQAKKIYLQVENQGEDEAELDLINVAANMGKRKRLYIYLLAIAAVAGVFVSFAMMFVKQFIGKNSYAQAVVSLQYDGIEEGLDPNGASLDINKIKSPVVIEDALSQIGITGISVEDIRENIEIEGVIPKDAVERITVIKEMALDDVSNYEKILDISYFPSQYVVTLYQDRGMSSSDTRDILNAVLESYRSYFLDTYANTEALTITGNLVDYTEYDYTEAADMLRAQIDIMRTYVAERYEQAPDFRSSNTGLSFGDISTSLETIESIDLSNLSSYVEANSLTKNREKLAEYYNYRIKRYNMQLNEQQVNLTTVENAINNYVKDPVVIVSSQDSTQQLSQGNEYYDRLIQQKLDISSNIAKINTELNDTYELLNSLSASNRQSTQSEMDYADSLIEQLIVKITDWTRLIEETTDEYYSTTLFSNAVKIAVPARYKAAGGLMSILKNTFICVAVAVFLVVVVWSIDGLRMELASMRRKNNCK